MRNDTKSAQYVLRMCLEDISYTLTPRHILFEVYKHYIRSLEFAHSANRKMANKLIIELEPIISEYVDPEILYREIEKGD